MIWRAGVNHPEGRIRPMGIDFDACPLRRDSGKKMTDFFLSQIIDQSVSYWNIWRSSVFDFIKSSWGCEGKETRPFKMQNLWPQLITQHNKMWKNFFTEILMWNHEVRKLVFCTITNKVQVGFVDDVQENFNKKKLTLLQNEFLILA